jgi:cell division protein FtsA
VGRDNIIVGLEIGTHKVCAAVGETGRDGALRILGVGEAPSRGVRKGEIVDFDTAVMCVRDAIVDAETKTDVAIRGVCLAVTGSHFQSFNNRGSVVVPDEREVVSNEDCDNVEKSAREVSIPSGHAFLHSVLQHYRVDGKEGVLNPVGMAGSLLEADYHVIHGVKTRITNSIQCVKEAGLEVEDVAFSAFATAQAVLTPGQKELGALVVDMGGGTTDFIVYSEGAVKQSGVLAVGGDHVTNDISMGLRIPINRAERLKVEEGGAVLGTVLPGETVFLKDDSGFAGKHVERETLNTVIHLRMREVFELLRKKVEAAGYYDFLGGGVMLTGGCSQLKSIRPLAEEVFGLPVHATNAQAVDGVTSTFEKPQYSTAVGLVRYAMAAQMDRERPGILGRLGRVFRKFRLF